MIAFAVKGTPSDQTADSVNPKAPDMQEITVREMIYISNCHLLVQTMDCRLIIAKPLSKLIQTYD